MVRLNHCMHTKRSLSCSESPTQLTLRRAGLLFLLISQRSKCSCIKADILQPRGAGTDSDSVCWIAGKGGESA